MICSPPLASVTEWILKPPTPAWISTNPGKNDRDNPPVMTNHQRRKQYAILIREMIKLLAYLLNLTVHTNIMLSVFVCFCYSYPVCQNETFAKIFCPIKLIRRQVTLSTNTNFISMISLHHLYPMLKNFHAMQKCVVSHLLSHSLDSQLKLTQNSHIPITKSCPSILFQNHPT